MKCRRQGDRDDGCKDGAELSEREAADGDAAETDAPANRAARLAELAWLGDLARDAWAISYGPVRDPARVSSAISYAVFSLCP